jgi:signal transduction histidine kinase
MARVNAARSTAPLIAVPPVPERPSRPGRCPPGGPPRGGWAPSPTTSTWYTKAPPSGGSRSVRATASGGSTVSTPASCRPWANQAAPALASLRLQEELRTSREQIVTAREEERRHLRRDIHDGLGPTLAGLRLRVENATLRLPADDPVREALRGVSDGLGTAVTEVRRITEHLGPAPLAELGLTGALRQLVCAFDGARTRIDADLSPSFLPSLSAAVEVAAYRIAAEALTNVVRHARAAHAHLRVRVDADRLTLTVLDDGVGIDPEPRHRGVGLRSMTERAAEIGGHCSIDRLSPGTRVCAVLPRSFGAGLHAPREALTPGVSTDELGGRFGGHRAQGAKR